MKTTIAAIIATTVLATSAIAQQTTEPASLAAAISTSDAPYVADAKSQPMSITEVHSITANAVHEAVEAVSERLVSEQLTNITSSEVNVRLAGTFDDLVSGKAVSFASPLSGLSNHSIIEQYWMNVQVRFEPRPIGGILSIVVELVPVFCGVGLANRPAAYRKLSQAIESLDEEGLGQLVSDLSHELGVDYAAKQPLLNEQRDLVRY